MKKYRIEKEEGYKDKITYYVQRKTFFGWAYELQIYGVVQGFTSEAEAQEYINRENFVPKITIL